MRGKIAAAAELHAASHPAHETVNAWYAVHLQSVQGKSAAAAELLVASKHARIADDVSLAFWARRINSIIAVLHEQSEVL